MPASVLRNARRLFLFSSAQNDSSSPVETGGGYVMPNENTKVQAGYFTQERIQGDLDYRRAQEIAKKMLDDGLISVAEINKLTAINRETFSPLFAEIMPKIPWYVVALEWCIDVRNAVISFEKSNENLWNSELES